jgi:hypothetical protein
MNIFNYIYKKELKELKEKENLYEEKVKNILGYLDALIFSPKITKESQIIVRRIRNHIRDIDINFYKIDF